MTDAPGTGGSWVLGVDSGGSGLRCALAPAGAPRSGPQGRPAWSTLTSAEPVRTGPRGIDAQHLLAQLVPAGRALLARAAEQTDAGGAGPSARIDAVCVGAAGMATLGADLRAELPAALHQEFGVRRLALAADAVTAYAGALGSRPGAVVAAGTGMIALGTDLRTWHRADGWGHLLGDCGGGAWIGRAGLAAALRALDGRRGGSPALLARAEAVFGPLTGLPGQLYPRTDRPALLASFAPEVARCAAGASPDTGSADSTDAPDTVAREILRDAAREIVDTAEAACPAAEGSEVALTGGLFELGEPLLEPVRADLAARLPHTRLVPARGSVVDGAVRIAGDLVTGDLRLPADPALLHLTGVPDTRP